MSTFDTALDLARGLVRAAPEGEDRADAPPVVALAECLDSWTSGAWLDTEADLTETMGHLARLLASLAPHPDLIDTLNTLEVPA